MKENYPTTSNPDVVESFKTDVIRPMANLVRILPPEQQYVQGATALGLIATIATAPERLPQPVQKIAQLIQPETFADKAAFSIVAAGALAITIDGARRIAHERLPYARAYVNTFVLNR